jgi:hypothetical protein
MTEPSPNCRNARPAGVPAVTIPARWNSRHPQCTARHTSARRASLIRPVPAFHDITRAFSRARQPGVATWPRPIRLL